MLNRLRHRLQGEQGFTLIELLVVILIIGILAAIAIPSFLNQKDKGTDAAAKSSARNAQTAMETYYTDNSTYATDANGLRTIEASLPAAGTAAGAPNNSLWVSATGGFTGAATQTAYRITVTSANGHEFWIDKNGSTIQRGCSPIDSGGCNHTGSW